jgi:ribosome-associated toxin RatA of RatAB toxin-antitoxin module
VRTVDSTVADAPLEVCFRVAAAVEKWPDILPHYRYVRLQRRDGSGPGLVEMAARRDFGPIPYPVWWVSEMSLDEGRPAVLYRHVRGITRGMEVVWSFRAVSPGATAIEIVHEWDAGPAWPLPGPVRRWIADLVIGPVFIHHVASRTLAGVRRQAERVHQESRGPRS